MKKITLIFALSFSVVSCGIFTSKKMDTRAKKLRQAAEQDDYATFFKMFPDTYGELEEIYGFDMEKGAKPLYDVHYEHIRYLFENKEKTAIKTFAEKLYNIAKNGVWEADAVGIFQDKLSEWIIEKPAVFVEILTTKTEGEIKGFWGFVFDTSPSVSRTDLSLHQKFSAIYNKINALDQKQGNLLREKFEERFVKFCFGC